MNESDLPKHVLGRIEQRWASRLQRDAAAWRSERPVRGSGEAVIDRSGRSVPVTVKRTASHKGPDRAA